MLMSVKYRQKKNPKVAKANPPCISQEPSEAFEGTILCNGFSWKLIRSKNPFAFPIQLLFGTPLFKTCFMKSPKVNNGMSNSSI